MKALTRVRSLAIAKANTLQRAHRHLDILESAFAEWAAGEIYVCKKTRTYRHRFGARSKGVTAWDAIAREVFPTPEAFAFAAMVFAPNTPPAEDATAPEAPAAGRRVNVIALAA